MPSLAGVVCPPCTDVQPPGPYTCTQQREFGKCEAPWMKSRRYCLKTCGACDPCNERTQRPPHVFTPPPEPPSPPWPPPDPNSAMDFCACSDIPPSLEYTCAQQRDFGKCDAVWMVDNSKVVEGFCQTTCGRCDCPGSPILPAFTLPKPLPTENCSCTDEPPPGTTLTCKEQRVFGKCFSVWMVDSSMRKEGYCQTTCGRCPCIQQLPDEPDTRVPMPMPVSLPGWGGPVLNGNSTTLQSPAMSRVSGPVDFDSPEVIDGLPSGARAIVLRNPNGPPVVLIVSPPTLPSVDSSMPNKVPEPSIPAIPPEQLPLKESLQPSGPGTIPITLPPPLPEPPEGTTLSPVAPSLVAVPPLVQPLARGRPPVITLPPATAQPLPPPRRANETAASEPVKSTTVPPPVEPPVMGQPADITSPPAMVRPLIPPQPPSEVGVPVVPVIVVDLEAFKEIEALMGDPLEELDGLGIDAKPAEQQEVEPTYEGPTTDLAADLDEELAMEPMIESPLKDLGAFDLDEPSVEPIPEPDDAMEELILAGPAEEPEGELDALLDELDEEILYIEPLDELKADFVDDLEEGMGMEPVPEPEENFFDMPGVIQPEVEPLGESSDQILDGLLQVPIVEPLDEEEGLEDALDVDYILLRAPSPDDNDLIDVEVFESVRAEGSQPVEEPEMEADLDLIEDINTEFADGLASPSPEPVDDISDVDFSDDLEEGFAVGLDIALVLNPMQEPAAEPEEDVIDDDLLDLTKDLEPFDEEPVQNGLLGPPTFEATENEENGDLEEMDESPLQEPEGESNDKATPDSDIQEVAAQRDEPIRRRLPENCTNTADTLASNPDLKMLTRLLTVGGLMSRSGSLLFEGTLFAPNDEAITTVLKILGITFDELLDLSEILQGLLSFLLVDEVLFKEDLTNGLEVNPRLEGVDPLVILRSDFRLESTTRSIIVVVGSRDTARIVDSGIHSCDVAIYVIDEFLLPSLETVADSPGIAGLETGGGGDSDEDDSPSIEGYFTALEDVLDMEDVLLNNKGNRGNAGPPTTANQRDVGLEGFATRVVVDR